jgi:hypothetical protein
VWSIGGLSKHASAGPWGASHRRGVTKDPRPHLHKGRGSTWLKTGPAGRGRRGSTLWVFWNKSSLRADLRVFERVGCRGLGCVVDRGAFKTRLSWPLGSIAPSGGHKGPRTHLHKGRGLDLVEDGTRWRGRRGSTLWVFWNKSALRADLRVFERVGCRGLGCVVDRGAFKPRLSWPLGSITPSGGHKGPPDTPPQGAWA